MICTFMLYTRSVDIIGFVGFLPWKLEISFHVRLFPIRFNARVVEIRAWDSE